MKQNVVLEVSQLVGSSGSRRATRWVIAFDLDDTLILERDYAFSGFRAASALLKRMTGCCDLEDACRQQWKDGVRERIFNRALNQLGMRVGSKLIADLVEAYRNHRPNLFPLPDVTHLLHSLRDSPAVAGVALLSDGWLHGQRAKLEATGLSQFFDLVVLTDRWGRRFWKPHPRGYLAIEALCEAEETQFVYVADNPNKDFDIPAARGWITFRIKRPEGVYCAALSRSPGIPTHTVAELDEVSCILKKLYGVAGLS